jgi:hypothetical protein
MAQPATTQLPCHEADIVLALSAINTAQIQSGRRAAAIFNVPESTLRSRRAGTRARRDCTANSKKLTKLEEEVIIEHILDLDLRGFAPTLEAVRQMADKLLAARAAGHVGKNWPTNFIKRTDRLTTRFNQPYDRQRALCEDPEKIRAWFELVARTKATYGISNNDTYNFDETSFIIGKISS